MAKLDQLKNPGKKSDGESTGKSSEEIADVLGVSTRTAERMRNIINNADDETLEAVKSGEISISKADKITNEKKKPKTRKKTSSSDDISEALGDNSGTPSGLNFNHSDGIERPSNKLSGEEDSARTSERRSAYESGFVDGFKQAAAYIFFQVKKDKFIEEIEKEFDGAKKTFAKLSSFVPKEIEIPEEEYDGKELTFDDSNENEAFDLGIDEE